jgi:hypothetical protein
MYQINGSTDFFNSPHKIMKFDAIGFENRVELRENNWKWWKKNSFSSAKEEAEERMGEGWARV